MTHEYERRKQGRDFSILAQLHSAEISAECNYNNIDGIVGNNDPKDDGGKKKSLLEQLEYYKTVAERNSEPVNGRDPPEIGR
jgi:hypothetical protein